jgi:outer membrane lipoprotein-sorting protein
MTLREKILAVLAVLALAGAAPARAQTDTSVMSTRDLGLIAKANQYLQGLGEVRGRFEQTSPRGAVSTGDLYLKRPGKARFQYDLPSGLQVVSDGRNVSVYDARLNTFDRAPLDATPLSILLARQVRLDLDTQITRVGVMDGGFYLTARNARGQARSEGYITIVFGQNPTVLRGWTLVDGQGQATKVKVEALKAQPIDPAIFMLNDPRPAAPKGVGPQPARP